MLIIILIVVIAVLVYLIQDFYGPKRIYLRPATSFNPDCSRVKELIIQGSDNKGNIWASRGMTLYCLKAGNAPFIKIAHVPTGLSYYWLNNFSLFRRFTNKPECLEATITSNGNICALSAGFMWIKTSGGVRFKKTMKLTHYGFGMGRGILSNGLLTTVDGKVFFGEYFRNTERGPVKIFRSYNNGQDWDIALEFAPGIIRHVHALQSDPYTGRLWICTGDKDNESFIGWSDDDFKSIARIGEGNQIWRSCQLVFTEDAVYWGTDTGSIELAGIYRWDRKIKETKQLITSAGAILYGTKLLGGTIVFSTDREGFPNERDMRTRLFVINQNQDIFEFELGTWYIYKKGIRYSFAMTRMPRSQGDSALFISLMNQKEFSPGEMLIFSETKMPSLARI